MADLDKNRHDFLQTLRSFNSKLKPDIVLINESTKDIIIGLNEDQDQEKNEDQEIPRFGEPNRRKRIHSPLLRF
jgi:hypothetical protein